MTIQEYIQQVKQEWRDTFVRSEDLDGEMGKHIYIDEEVTPADLEQFIESKLTSVAEKVREEERKEARGFCYAINTDWLLHIAKDFDKNEIYEATRLNIIKKYLSTPKSEAYENTKTQELGGANPQSLTKK